MGLVQHRPEARQHALPAARTCRATRRSQRPAGLDLPSLGQSLDFINIMTYDFHGACEQGEEGVDFFHCMLRDGRGRCAPMSLWHITAIESGWLGGSALEAQGCRKQSRRILGVPRLRGGGRWRRSDRRALPSCHLAVLQGTRM